MELDNIVFTRVFDVMTIPIPEGTRKQIKNRYGYGLTFCETPSGKIVYEFKGKKYTSDYNHCVLLPMGQTYYLNGISSGNFPLINFYCYSPLNKDDFAVFELSSPSYYLQTYERIKELCRQADHFSNARVFGMVYEMVSHLMLDTSSKSSDILSMAMAYMDDNYTNPELTIEEVAAHAHVSAGYLRRVFKSKYSVSPKKYVLNARMMRAKDLLLSEEYTTVMSIAQQSGYTNIYHFDRAFRSYFGCSPTAYQQRFVHSL